MLPGDLRPALVLQLGGPFQLLLQEVVQARPDRRDGRQQADLLPGGRDRGVEDVGPQQELQPERSDRPRLSRIASSGTSPAGPRSTLATNRMSARTTA